MAAAISRAGVALAIKTLPILPSRLFSSYSCSRVISGRSDTSDNLYSDENSLDFMPCLKLRTFLTRAEQEMIEDYRTRDQLVLFSKNPSYKRQNHFVLFLSADSQASEAVRLVHETKFYSGNVSLQVPISPKTASKAMDIVYECLNAKDKLEQEFLSVIFSDRNYNWYEFTKFGREFPVAVQILGTSKILFNANKNGAILPNELKQCSHKIERSIRTSFGESRGIISPERIAIELKKGNLDARIAAALLNVRTFSGLSQINSNRGWVNEFKIVS